MENIIRRDAEGAELSPRGKLSMDLVFGSNWGNSNDDTDSPQDQDGSNDEAGVSTILPTGYVTEGAFGRGVSESNDDPCHESNPTSAELQNEAYIKSLYNRIHEALNTRARSDYEVGEACFLIQQERAKPGTGTFIKDIEVIEYEFEISERTIYRRINFYKAVKAELVELEVVRLRHADKDVWPMVCAGEDDEAEEKVAADAKAAQEGRAIEEATQRVKQKREENLQRAPVKTLALCGLSKESRKEVHTAFSTLKTLIGENEASDFVARAIVSHVEYLSHRTDTGMDRKTNDE